MLPNGQKIICLSHLGIDRASKKKLMLIIGKHFAKNANDINSTLLLTLKCTLLIIHIQTLH